MNPPVIIIGAGLAGWTSAREFRKLDTDTELLLVTADSGDFYAKPSLSNAFAQGRLPAQLVSSPAAKMAETLNVTLLTHRRVASIDTAAQTIRVSPGPDTGEQTLAYRDLVLATGAQPIRVPVQGNAAADVMSVNSLADFAAFHARLQPTTDLPDTEALKPHVLIMGAGLIGCEFANDLAQAGYRVSLVDPGPHPLAAMLPPEASAALQAALEALGVRSYMGSTVHAIDTAAAGSNSLLQATLSNGDSVSADAVLSAVGLRAETTLAEAAGLVVDRGIAVNRYLQTSDPHVYALGDSAQYASAPSPLSLHGSTLPYVMPIMNAAKALASTLAGTPTEVVFPLMPVSVKTPALPLVIAAARVGLTGGWQAADNGIWQWLDEAGLARGFVLSGAQTSQRMAQAKLLTP